MVEELVRIAPLVPVMKFCVCPSPSTRAPVPVKVLSPPTYSTPWLPPTVAAKLIVPLLVMVPFTVRVAPVVVTESPALLRVRFPMETLKSSTVAAVVALIRISSPLVMAPLFQLPATLQSPLAPPFQVSVVTGGGISGVATGAWDSDCGESLCLDPVAACAKAGPSRVRRVARRQRTEIHGVTTREDAGRMGDSIQEILSDLRQR